MWSAIELYTAKSLAESFGNFSSATVVALVMGVSAILVPKSSEGDEEMRRPTREAYVVQALRRNELTFMHRHRMRTIDAAFHKQYERPRIDNQLGLCKPECLRHFLAEYLNIHRSTYISQLYWFPPVWARIYYNPDC